MSSTQIPVEIMNAIRINEFFRAAIGNRIDDAYPSLQSMYSLEIGMTISEIECCIWFKAPFQEHSKKCNYQVSHFNSANLIEMANNFVNVQCADILYHVHATIWNSEV